MRFLSRISLALVLVAFATAAFAGETGSISGVVKDGGGLPVPGATVTATGAQAPRTTVSNANGAFKFDKVLPGDYVVTADLKGLGTASQKLHVFVDNDAQLSLALVQAAKTEVIVTGASVEIDKKASEVNFNYTDNTIQDLPLSRTYQGVFKIIPGVANDNSGAGYVSMSGGTRQDNKYLLDGVNITNPGYGGLGVDTNQLDIADFNVKKGGITAEFGRTSGAMVNAVTKSGTNQIAGAVQFNYSPSGFQAKRAFDVQSDVDTWNAQANLGFPILKDMLFGYVSGAYYDSKTSGQSATVGGVTTTQPDTKAHNGDYFGKLTYFGGQSVLVNAGFRALPAKSDNVFNSVYDAATAAYGADTTNYVGNASVDWFISKNSVVEAKYVYFSENDTSSAINSLPAFQPAVINPANLAAYGAYSNPALPTGNNAGYPEFADTGDRYKRNEIKATYSQYFDAGSTQHAFKLGGGYEDTSNDTVRATSGWGTFIGGIGVSCPAGLCGPNAITNTVRARYYTSQPVQYSVARTYSAFLQDTITMKNLTVYLGVLVNKDDFGQVCKPGNICNTNGSATPLTEETRFNFMVFDWSQEIQPRIGITWNPNLLKSDKLYGTYGEYAGVDQKSTSRSFAPFRIRQDQAFFCQNVNGCAGGFGGTVYPYGTNMGSQYRGSSTGKVIPEDLKPPRYQELVLGYSAALTQDVSFDLYGQYRKLRNAFEDTPLPGNGNFFDPNTYGGFFRAANFFDARRVYKGVTLDVQKRYANGWYADANITFSSLQGNWDEDYGTGLFNTSSFLEDEPGWNSSDPNRWGKLGQDRPVIFKLMGSYDLPMGFVLGGFLRVQSGTPWEARGATPSTSGGRYIGNCTAGANGFADCTTAEAGNKRLPTWTTVDLLLGYNLKFGGDMAARIELRATNLFDTQTVLSVDQVQFKDAYVDGTTGLGWQRSTQPNALYGNATSWSSPRRFTLMARLDF